jgi:hypothetical protein
MGEVHNEWHSARPGRADPPDPPAPAPSADPPVRRSGVVPSRRDHTRTVLLISLVAVLLVLLVIVVSRRDSTNTVCTLPGSPGVRIESDGREITVSHNPGDAKLEPCVKAYGAGANEPAVLPAA